MKVRVNGPTPKEAAHAFYVAITADRFLDAYLAGKVTPELVRKLAVELEDLRRYTTGYCIGLSDLEERADTLLEADFSKAQWDSDSQNCWFEEEQGEETGGG